MECIKDQFQTICQGQGRAILNNIWSNHRGFSVKGTIFGSDQLSDMSCKMFKVQLGETNGKNEHNTNTLYDKFSGYSISLSSTDYCD